MAAIAANSATELPVIEPSSVYAAAGATGNAGDAELDAPEAAKADKDATAPLNVIDNVPADLVNLRLLLLSGRKTDILVLPTESIEAVRSKVLSNWPPEWDDERPKSTAAIRILYRGRFLEGGATIACEFGAFQGVSGSVGRITDASLWKPFLQCLRTV